MPVLSCFCAASMFQLFYELTTFGGAATRLVLEECHIWGSHAGSSRGGP